jgi:plasmid stability protein
MSKMIQIRNVPDQLHRKLKARAALAGMSLSDYLMEEVRVLAERPTVTELLERLAQRESITPSPPAAKAVRMERDGR